jgi:hypothetical protein
MKLPEGLFKFSETEYKFKDFDAPLFTCREKDLDKIIDAGLKALYNHAYRRGYNEAEDNVRHVVAMINPINPKEK